MLNRMYDSKFPEIDIDKKYVLRELLLEDGKGLYEYYSHEVSKHIYSSKPGNEKEAMDEIANSKTIFPSRRGVYWAFARKSDNKMIGAAGLYINNIHYRGEICYELAQSYWGRGLMSKVIAKMIDFSFNKAGLIRMEALVAPANIVSVGLLKKFNFEREGTLRRYRYHEGRFLDVDMYSLLK